MAWLEDIDFVYHMAGVYYTDQQHLNKSRQWWTQEVDNNKGLKGGKVIKWHLSAK